MDQSHVAESLRGYANQVADIRSGLPSGAGLRDSALTLAGQMLNNDFQYQMWQENNAYNTPAAQMKRLLDAGLNPNLAYQSVNTGNSGSPSSGGYDVGASVSARQKAVQTQTQRAQMVVGAISSGIDLMQKFFGMVQSGQQIQQNQMQLEFDKTVRSLRGDGSMPITMYTDANGVPVQLGLGHLHYLSRFGGNILPNLYNALNSTSLRDLQGTNSALNTFKLKHLLPWDERLKSQVFDAKEFQNNMLKYQMEMLNTMPPFMRQAYMLFIGPLLNLLPKFVQ